MKFRGSQYHGSGKIKCLAALGNEMYYYYVCHCVLCPGFGRKEVVEYLLENGAKVNAHDDGMLLLHSSRVALVGVGWGCGDVLLFSWRGLNSCVSNHNCVDEWGYSASFSPC